MRHHYFPLLLPLTALALLPSCIDKDYDLFNADTTSEIKVNDLVVPVNLNAINLQDATDLDKSEFITVIDGEYAFTQTQNFKAADIHIPQFSIRKPTVPAVKLPLTLLVNNAASNQKRAALDPFKDMVYDFNYSGYLTNAVKGVDHLGTQQMTLRVRLTLKNANASVEMRNLRFQFPKGLDQTGITAGCTYDKSTGIYTVKDVNLNNNSEVRFELSANGISGDQITITPVDDDNNLFTLDSEIGIRGVEFMDYTGSMSYSPYVEMAFDVPNIVGTDISASVALNVDGISFTGLNLDNLPDFLKGDNTTVRISNPQLFLGVTNNVGDFAGTAPLTYISHFKNHADTHGSTTTPLTVTTANRTNVLMAPDPGAVEFIPADYQNPAPALVQFPAFSDVLYAGQEGYGLPTSIDVVANNVQITGSHVRNLPLGVYTPGFEGSYTLIAPLSLGKGSHIYYTNRETGWDSDELKDLVIKKLTLNATAATEMPFNLKLKLNVLDSEGHVIATSNEMTINGNGLGTDPQPVNLTIESDEGFSGMDGVEYTATIVQPNNNNDALTPETSILLENIRITVSGAYIHDFSSDDND